MQKVILLCLTSLLCAQALTKPRGARSVHLAYPSRPSTAFYNELTVEKSAAGSYFMVCGFRQGYFGIQDLGRGRSKTVLFSVWDRNSGDDHTRVPADQRVEVLYKAEDVVVRRFSGEGTGGQSFFDYDWKIGNTYRFRVEATTEGNRTSFAAWFFLNELRVWKHLVTFRAVTGGFPLSDLYSFIEDFHRDGKSLGQPRSALFGNGWARGTDGVWAPLAEARFTADATAVGNIDAGVREGHFYLGTGGDTANHTAIDSMILCQPSVQRPPELR